MAAMTRTSDTGNTGESLGILTRRFFYAMRTLAEEALPPTGFSMPQFGVMMWLRRHPGESAADLARRAFVTPQTMGEILAALEEAGHIRRSPAEGRKIAIKLTRRGEAALDICNTALKSVEGRMFAPLGTRDREKLGELLALCLNNISLDMARSE